MIVGYSRIEIMSSDSMDWLLPPDVRAPLLHPFVEGHPPHWASCWGHDRFGVFAGFRVGEVEYRLRWVPPGKSFVGSPASEFGRFDDEGPRQEVVLSRGFWLGDTPCTQALWVKVVGTNPSRFAGLDQPVERVSWYDCQGFLDRLGRLCPGCSLRLPAEREWEFACRAATETATWNGDLRLDVFGYRAVNLDPIAWYGANSRGRARPVRGKRPNSLGLYDMLGNVWEWCQDRYDFYPGHIQRHRAGFEMRAGFVLRGGSWDSRGERVRAASRYWFSPGSRHSDVGFRILIEA